MNLNNMKMLNDEALVTAIEKYVDEYLYNYAVMIDGAWGCGKTYFVTQVLKPKLEEHEEKKEKDIKGYKKRNVIYVSLYGIKAIGDISKQLYMEEYFGKDNEVGKMMKKGASIISSMIPLAFDIAKPFIKNMDVSENNVTNVISEFLSIKNSILIFDDLERCECPINEVLGYINSFVEHENMKVILIANQLEIGKNIDQRKELQYLVAAGGNGIDFQNDHNSQRNQILQHYKESNGKDEKKEELISIEQLEMRADILFGKNTEYERIREKLVGITLYYSPDLEKVLKELLSKVSVGIDLKRILKENIDYFVQYMEQQNHRNLRTFQFYLSKIEDLYNAIIVIENQAQTAFINYIVKYCFEICVHYKAGSLIYEWEGKEEYEYTRHSKTDIFGTTLGFRFVDDFVINSVLDDTRIEKMLLLYEEEVTKNQNAYDSLFRQLEFTWHLLEDAELEERLKEFLQELDQNKYRISEYARIVPLLLRLEKLGFSEEYLTQALGSMKKNLSQLNTHASLDGLYHPGDDKDINQRTREILKELNHFIDENFKESVKDTMRGILNEGNGWADKLFEYTKQNKNDIHNSSGFLLQLDVNMLVSKVINSNPKDIYVFRSCIFEVYDVNYTHGILDCEKKDVKKLLVGIKACDRNGYGKTKCMQLDWLIEALQNTITEYMGDTMEDENPNN